MADSARGSGDSSGASRLLLSFLRTLGGACLPLPQDSGISKCRSPVSGSGGGAG